MAEGESGGPSGAGRGMASIVVDGKRIPLTADGIRSIAGTAAEVARKVADALRRQVLPPT